MLDLDVIILAKNEEIHMARCLERLAPLAPHRVFVVDCFSSDATVSIARSRGAVVVQREWPGLYAKQFNWALDNLPLEASWILRLDADEYLFPETIAELRGLLPEFGGNGAGNGNLPANATSITLTLARVFLGRRIKWGGTARIPMVRIFRRGLGRCEDRAMDEHIVTREGSDFRLEGGFADDNLNGMDWWREKHRGYAAREAADALARETFKPSKTFYYRMPPYFRAFAYFCYRYFLRLGFLDGYAGWMWHFWQGLWYRCLVDRTIGAMKRDMRRAAAGPATRRTQRRPGEGVSGGTNAGR